MGRFVVMVLSLKGLGRSDVNHKNAYILLIWKKRRFSLTRRKCPSLYVSGRDEHYCGTVN